MSRTEVAAVDMTRAPVPPLRQHSVTLAISAIGLGSFLALAFFGRQVFLFSDDYIFLSEARDARLSRSYLSSPLFTHFSPVSRLLHWLVAPLIPTHSAVVYWALLGLAAALVLSVVVLMLALHGRTWYAVLGVGLVAPSLSILPLMNWWTAGANLIPAFVGGNVCFAGVVLLVRTRRWAWGLVAIVAYLLGVLSWELAAAVPAFVALWLLLFRRRLPRSERLTSMVRCTAWVWVALGVIGILTLLNYRLHYYSPSPLAPADQVWHALYTSLFETQIPLTLGLHQPANPLVSGLGAAIGMLLVAVLLVVTLRRSRLAWRGWLFALLGWLVPCAALVLSRVGLWGPVVAEQPIYFFLPSVLSVAGVLEAWRAPDLRPQATPRAAAPAGRPFLRRGAALAALAACALAYVTSSGAVIGSIFGFGAVAATGAPLPDYVPNVLTSAANLQARGEPFSIVSRNVPDGLVPPGFSPFNRLSRVLEVNQPTVPVNGYDENWYAPRASGELVAVRAIWQRSVPLGQPGQRVALSFAGMEPVRTTADDGACFQVTSEDAHLVVPLGGPVSGKGLVVRTQATVDQATPGRMIVGLPNVGFTPANVDPGRWRTDAAGRLDPVLDSRIDSVGYDGFSPGVTFCLRTVFVGVMPLPD